jgi:hypothetical protein
MAPVAAKLEGADASDLKKEASDDAGEDEPGESGTDSTPLTTPDKDRPRSQRKLPAPNRQLSPFEIRFSQMRARHEFRDKKLLEESVPQIRLVRCEDKECKGDVRWRTEAPFPPIEVLQWRCKLRDESTGRPLMDPDTGEEMWDTSDRWFTLDNRRLYCLQKAAVAVWPEQVDVDVVELKGALTRIRELKKFRTLDTGRSIYIGGRKEGETLVRWCWWEAAGLSSPPEPKELEEHERTEINGDEPALADGSGSGFVADRVQLRQRKRYTSGGRSMDGRGGGRTYSGSSQGSRSGNGYGWSKRGGKNSANADDETESRFGGMSWGSLVVFLGIYVALRFFTKLATAVTARGEHAAVEANSASSTGSPFATTILTGGTAALLAAIIVHFIRLKLQ